MLTFDSAYSVTFGLNCMHQAWQHLASWRSIMPFILRENRLNWAHSMNGSRPNETGHPAPPPPACHPPPCPGAGRPCPPPSSGQPTLTRPPTHAQQAGTAAGRARPPGCTGPGPRGRCFSKMSPPLFSRTCDPLLVETTWGFCETRGACLETKALKFFRPS